MIFFTKNVIRSYLNQLIALKISPNFSKNLFDERKDALNFYLSSLAHLTDNELNEEHFVNSINENFKFMLTDLRELDNLINADCGKPRHFKEREELTKYLMLLQRLK